MRTAQIACSRVVYFSLTHDLPLSSVRDYDGDLLLGVHKCDLHLSAHDYGGGARPHDLPLSSVRGRGYANDLCLQKNLYDDDHASDECDC